MERQRARILRTRFISKNDTQHTHFVSALRVRVSRASSVRLRWASVAAVAIEARLTSRSAVDDPVTLHSSTPARATFTALLYTFTALTHGKPTEALLTRRRRTARA